MNLPLLLLTAFIIIPITIANPNSDGQILLNFASSIPHGRKLNWNASNPICSSWIGIKCTQNQMRVSSIRLPAVGLHGPIPPNTLGKLDALKTLSLRSNLLNGNLPPDLLSLPYLTFLYLQHNNLSGHIPFPLSSSRLAVIDLSFNSLTGRIPTTIGNLTNLSGLFLQHNAFSGYVPNIIGVRHLNVSHNRFNGSIPPSFKNFPESCFEGNPTLCGPPLKPCFSSIDHKKSSRRKLNTATIIVVIVAIAAFCVGLLLLIMWCLRRKRDGEGNVVKGDRKGSEKQSTKEEFGSGVQESEKNKLVFFQGFSYSFDLEDLLRASAEVLGKGSYGTAYKAVLEEGTTMVVKRLKEVVVGRKEFEEQMEIVGRMDSHPNVLPLRAYYYSKDEKLLVCDYVIMGSLSSILHGNNSSETGNPRLNWDARYKILLFTSHAVAHLHSSKLTHGNIKASNVLLTQTLDPLLSDSGLAPLFSPPSRASPAAYRAPEALETRKSSPKSDVYSFGVLVLEVLTGKAPEAADLPRWVQSVVREEWTAEVFDVELMRGESDEEELMGMLQIGMACVGKVPDTRPGIGDVVGMIEGIKQRSDSAKGSHTPTP